MVERTAQLTVIERVRTAWRNAGLRREYGKYSARYASWYDDDARLRAYVADAELSASPDGEEVQTPLVLKRDERVVSVLTGIGLAEPRPGARQWTGGYSGFSYRLSKNLRVPTGGSRGHSIQGPDELRLIDAGTATVTDRRIVFQGMKQNREWAFAKLLGFQHHPAQPYTAIQVSNRQRVSGLLYDTANAADVRFALGLAIARGTGTDSSFRADLDRQVDEHVQARPAVPPALVSASWLGSDGAFSSDPAPATTAERSLTRYRLLPTWAQFGIPLAAVALFAAAAGGSGGASSDPDVTSRRTPQTTESTEFQSTIPTLPPTTLAPITLPATVATLPPPPPPIPASSNCDPNYSGCVPIASDVDCAGGSGNGPAYTGEVQVIGSDIYDLDADGDGIACE